MHKFEPLIARFVEDVLRAVRTASLDELRDLLAPETTPAPSAPRRAERAMKTARAPVARPQRTRAARLPAVRAKVPAPQSEAPVEVEELPEIAEITDPERLLAAELEASSAHAPPPAPSAAEQGEPPPSSERLHVGRAATLRDGESLARADGAAVVIRRAKKLAST
jgi:hypothetical protein